MSKIKRSEIENSAKLSRIDLSSENIDSISQEFESILDFVETIQKADTTNVEPTSQVTGLNDIWRDDVVIKSAVEPKDLLKLSPETDGNYIKVKKVL